MLAAYSATAQHQLTQLRKLCSITDLFLTTAAVTRHADRLAQQQSSHGRQGGGRQVTQRAAELLQQPHLLLRWPLPRQAARRLSPQMLWPGEHADALVLSPGIASHLRRISSPVSHAQSFLASCAPFPWLILTERMTEIDTAILPVFTLAC